MIKDSDELVEERQSLLSFIWQNIKTIIYITGGAAIVSVVAALLMPNIYKSTAVVYSTATNRVSFSEQRNTIASSMDFGATDRAEQLIQILESAKVRDKIVKQFNLIEHYEIEPDDPNLRYHTIKEWSQHVLFFRTRYGSVQIDVFDEDRFLAAEICNQIVDYIDTVKNDLIRERALPALEIYKRKKQMLEDDKNKILSELDSLSLMGVASKEARSRLYAAYTESRTQADKDFFKSKIDSNIKFGAKFDALEKLRDEKIGKMSKFEEAYEQAESDAHTTINHKLIVEPAVVADKKDSPKRSVIVILATVGAFIFAIFFLLVKERISELRKTV